MDPIQSARMIDSSARGWDEATRAARKARRPHGWTTTPHGLLERVRKREPQAVSSLCAMYWEPVRKYLQQRCHASRADAEDATQGCFTRLLAPPKAEARTPPVAAVERTSRLASLVLDPEDSFGAWLVTRAWYFLHNHWKQQKRHQPLVSAPTTPKRLVPAEERRALAQFELRSQLELRQQAMDPERRADEARARTLVEQGFAVLRPEYEREGLTLLFEHLMTTLLELETDATDAEICQRLGYGRSYVGKARHTLRWVELPAAMLALKSKGRSQP